MPEDILFHLTLVEAEKGVAVSVVSGIELFVRLLPERPISLIRKEEKVDWVSGLSPIRPKSKSMFVRSLNGFLGVCALSAEAP